MGVVGLRSECRVGPVHGAVLKRRPLLGLLPRFDQEPFVKIDTLLEVGEALPRLFLEIGKRPELTVFSFE